MCQELLFNFKLNLIISVSPPKKFVVMHHGEIKHLFCRSALSQISMHIKLWEVCL